MANFHLPGHMCIISALKSLAHLNLCIYMARLALIDGELSCNLRDVDTITYRIQMLD